MHEGRQKSEWGRASAIVAIIAESNRNTKKRRQPFTSDDFNPYAEKSKQKVAEGFAILKAAFVPETKSEVDRRYEEWITSIKSKPK